VAAGVGWASDAHGSCWRVVQLGMGVAPGRSSGWRGGEEEEQQQEEGAAGSALELPARAGRLLGGQL